MCLEMHTTNCTWVKASEQLKLDEIVHSLGTLCCIDNNSTTNCD